MIPDMSKLSNDNVMITDMSKVSTRNLSAEVGMDHSTHVLGSFQLPLKKFNGFISWSEEQGI